MKFWGLAVVAFLVLLGPAQADISLPPIEDQLRLYEKQLIAKANQDTRPSIELLRVVREALAAGKTSAAIDALEVLAGKHNGEGEGGFGTWLKLALAYQARMTSHTKKLALSDGTAAAFGAYKRADTDPDRIAALSALGGLLLRAAAIDDEEEQYETSLDEQKEAEEEPQPDLNNRDAARSLAYTVFTELGRLVADDRYQGTLDKLSPEFHLDKVTFPPRPDQYSGDSYPCSDTTGLNAEGAANATEEEQPGDVEFFAASKASCETSRAQYSCLVFSHSLGANLDAIAGAISVMRVGDSSGSSPKGDAPSPYPALVQDKKVCYSLEFGAHYKFIIDPALKSASGESLKRKTVARLDMPDKGSLLGFKRGTYVLPAKGQGNITVDTINVKRAELKLRRIGDRNLVREILLDHVVGGFADDTDDTCFLLDEVSEGIADGAVTLAGQQATKNKSVPLVLPVDTILTMRRDWLDKKAGAKDTLDIADKDAKLAFTMLDDPAAASSKLKSQSGVFALFGSITEPLTDAPKTVDAAAEDSCSDRRFAAQWFIITDMGLVLQTSHKNLYVVARSLSSTKAIKNARIDLVARSGLVLDSQLTDERGVATFPARLGQGTGGNELVAVMAYGDDDFSFLDKTASELDLADRGFEGGVGPDAEVNAFIAPIRGIFRPGDLVEGLVLIRDLNGHALDKVPPFELQLIEQDSGSVLATEKVSGESEQSEIATEQGGFRFHMVVPEEVRQGTAKLVVSVGGRVAGETDPLEIRYFQPATIAVQDVLGTWSAEIDPTGMFTLKGDARADYLFGKTLSAQGTDAPASGLPVEYEVRLVKADSPVPGCFEGFSFGRGVGDYRPELFSGQSVPTDANGVTHVDIAPSRLTQTQVDLPLKAEVTLKVLDANAVAATHKIEVPVKRIGRHWIGVKLGGPQTFSPSRPSANAVTLETVFQVVALDPDGKAETLGIPTTISRLNNGFVWTLDGSGWDYVPDPGKSRIKLKDLTVDYNAEVAPDACPKPSVVSIPLGETGNYVVELKGKDGVTELSVHNGWTTAKDGSLEPDSLVVWAPKKQFATGESIKIGVDTPYRSGTVLGELIANGTLLKTFEAEIDKDGRADAEIPVDRNWQEGAMHIYVTALRKPDGSAAELGPARAIGGTMIRIGADAGDPKLSIEAPDRIQPLFVKNDPKLKIVADGFAKDTWVALAVVDEGILSVTQFQTPSPVEHFLGRRWLDLQVFDTYGRLLSGKFGGDAIAGLRGMDYQPGDLVVWMSQIQKAADGSAEFTIPRGGEGIPESFQGELRVMAWAWDGEKFAVAEHHIDVRDPIVVQLSTPQRMAPGDTAVVPLRVTPVELSQQLSIEARVDAGGALRFADNVAGADAGAACDQGDPLEACRRYAIDAQKGVQSVLRLPIKATDVDDVAGDETNIALSYKLSETQVARNSVVRVRPSYMPITVALKRPDLAPGQSITIDRDYFEKAAAGIAADMDANDLRLSVRLAKQDLMPTPDDSSGLSAALPLDQRANSAQIILANMSLDVPDGAAAGGPSAEKLTALARDILLLQGPDGSFAASVKPGVRYYQHDDAYKSELQPDSVGQTAFALDVLSRINAISPTVGDAAVDRAAGYLLSELNLILTPDDDGDLAACTRSRLYAANVLTKLNRMGGGFLQRVGAACMKSLETDPVGKVMLASAYKAFGLTKEVDGLMTGIDGETLAATGTAPADIARAVALFVENQPQGAQPIAISTGEKPVVVDQATASWWARAQAALLKTLQTDAATVAASDIKIEPEGVERVPFPFGVDVPRLSLKEVSTQPVTISNQSAGPFKVSVLGEGVPASLDGLGQPSYAVDLSFIGRNGPITPKDGTIELTQFETVYCIVAINQKNDGYSTQQQLGVVQVLPTGFEVVDEHYKFAWEQVVGHAVDSSAISVLDYAETRPDRWIALPRSKDSGVETQLLAFSMRPTLVGDFALPSLLVSDLRNPARSGWTPPLRVKVNRAE